MKSGKCLPDLQKDEAHRDAPQSALTMKICGIYARKSTDQSAVADESKSVTRQVEHARQYAAGKGWNVDESAIFVDDGVSGAEFDRRPGFMRLMAAVKRPTFNVLIMSESSRLGREAWETGYALKQILAAGVRVFFYLENRECSFDHPLDKLQFSLVQAFDEMERTRASQRSTDKALQLARAGHVTGGRVFGYDNVRVDSHTERRINEPEATVVQRIFQMAAAGIGQKRIAQRLNAERALSPQSQRNRPMGWAQSSVRSVLFRPLYRGQIVWNRTRKRNQFGEARTKDRPASEWLTVDAPQLRIVSDELWAAAQARITAARELHKVGTPEAQPGRPAAAAPRFLLTGFARCSCCNGGLHVRSQQGGSPGRRVRVRVYACTTYHNRGADVCANNLGVRMETVDRAVMEAIGDVLVPDLAEETIVRVRELLEPLLATDPRGEVVAEIEALERQIGHLTEAIAMGGNLPALVVRLQQAEERRQTLLRTRDATPAASPLPRIDWRRLEAEARLKLAGWRELMTRHVAEGRQLLAAVLHGPIVFTPFREERARGYRFAGELAIGGLLGGVAEVIQEWCTRGSTAFRMASPPGIAPDGETVGRDASACAVRAPGVSLALYSPLGGEARVRAA
jgi:site-specific DNA recombinase